MALRILESRVDWLTYTSRTALGASELFDLGLKIIKAAEGRGDYERDWQWNSYRGHCIRGASVGYRMDGAIVRLSGERAGANWRSIATVKGRPTRVDLCVTASDDDWWESRAVAGYENALNAIHDGGRPTGYSLIRNNAGGETLYCGRRASERFGRLYLKSAEEPGKWPGFSWRWEIEYKGELAETALNALRGARSERETIVKMVHDEFERWSVVAPHVGEMGASWVPSAPRETSDAEKTMRWLTEQVAPALEKAGAFYSSSEILRALNLFSTRELQLGEAAKAQLARMALQ